MPLACFIWSILSSSSHGLTASGRRIQDSCAAFGCHVVVSTPNCRAYSAFSRGQSNFIASPPAMRPIGRSAEKAIQDIETNVPPGSTHRDEAAIDVVPQRQARAAAEGFEFPPHIVAAPGVLEHPGSLGSRHCRFGDLRRGGSHRGELHGASNRPQAAIGFKRSPLAQMLRVGKRLPDFFGRVAQIPDEDERPFFAVLFVRAPRWPGPVCTARERSSFSWSSFSLRVVRSCGRGGVREHRGERTRTGGTEPARHRPPEAAPVSGGRDGAARPPWIRRNRRRAGRAGALTPPAAASPVDARSLRPTVATRPGGSISRGGSAPQ